MKIDKQLAVLFLAITVIGILLMSLSAPFYYHLRVDLYGQYINHVKNFLQDGNLSHLGYNEYQPVAVMFFISLSPFYLFSSLNITQYVHGLYLANIILIIAAAYLIYAFKRNYTNVFVFALVLLLTGPIVLNRFDMLVFVILLLSFLTFAKHRYFWSGLFMAIAILTKIYPVIFVPYMLYVISKNRGFRRQLPQHLSGYLAGTVAVLFVYCVLLQADFVKIFIDLTIHSIKPVHVESVWSSLLTLFVWMKSGAHVIGGGADGIYGILEQFIQLPKLFYNYFWVIPIATYYLFVFIKTRTAKVVHFDVTHLYVLALIFLVTSKILAPQYLLWVSLPFCLITVPESTNQRVRWSIQLFLLLLASVVTIFIYPLNYDSLINFYQSADGPQIVFWMTVSRNLSLLLLLFISWNVFKHEHETKQINLMGE